MKPVPHKETLAEKIEETITGIVLLLRNTVYILVRLQFTPAYINVLSHARHPTVYYVPPVTFLALCGFFCFPGIRFTIKFFRSELRNVAPSVFEELPKTANVFNPESLLTFSVPVIFISMILVGLLALALAKRFKKDEKRLQRALYYVVGYMSIMPLLGAWVINYIQSIHHSISVRIMIIYVIFYTPIILVLAALDFPNVEKIPWRERLKVRVRVLYSVMDQMSTSIVAVLLIAGCLGVAGWYTVVREDEDNKREQAKGNLITLAKETEIDPTSHLVKLIVYFENRSKTDSHLLMGEKIELHCLGRVGASKSRIRINFPFYLESSSEGSSTMLRIEPGKLVWGRLVSTFTENEFNSYCLLSRDSASYIIFPSFNGPDLVIPYKSW